MFNCDGELEGTNSRSKEVLNNFSLNWIEENVNLAARKQELTHIQSHFKTALDGETSEFKISLESDTGFVTHLRVKNIPILTYGRANGFFSIVQDLTEEHAVEQKLIE